MNWLRRHYLLILILIMALFLRTYRLGETMTFLEDEGRDLLIATRMIETRVPVLLGPQTSTGEMYLGPLYYYLITPALYLARMDPVGPAVLIALSGVLTTYLLFVLGTKWFSRRAGYLAAVLFAFLPYSVSVTRASWNPHLVPLITTLMLLTFSRLTTGKPHLRDWAIYGALFGTMVQLHYMALIFCGILSLLLLWSRRRDLFLLTRGVVWAVLAAAAILSPFILFELRNDWVNTKAVLKFVEPAEGQAIRYRLPAWLWWGKVSSTSYRLVGKTLIGSEDLAARSTQVAVSTYFVLFGLALILAYRRRQWNYLYVSMVFMAALAVLGIYQENIHLHYLEFSLPLIFLTLAGMFSLSRARIYHAAVAIFLLLIFSQGVTRTVASITSDPTHQIQKAQAVAEYILARAGSDPYNVVSTQGMYTTPFQYFLAISSHPPENDLQKRIFDICAGTPCPADDETTTLLFLTGPAHPALSAYLGHPELSSFSALRRMVSNEHVSVGTWVAEIVLE